MASVSDNFNRANENPIAAPWTSMNGGVQLSSNAIVSVGVAIDNAVRYSGAGLSGNQFAQVTLATMGGLSTASNGPMVRCGSSDFSAYLARASTVGHNIQKVVAGVFTGLAGGGAACVAGDVLYLEANSTTLQAKRNGTNTISVTDAALTVGDPGAYFALATVASLDTFSAGDLMTGQGLLLSHRRNMLVMASV